MFTKHQMFCYNVQYNLLLVLRQLEQQESRNKSEMDELLIRLSSLQEENRNLALDKANLSADIKRVEAELELTKQANRYKLYCFLCLILSYTWSLWFTSWPQFPSHPFKEVFDPFGSSISSIKTPPGTTVMFYPPSNMQGYTPESKNQN